MNPSRWVDNAELVAWIQMNGCAVLAEWVPDDVLSTSKYTIKFRTSGPRSALAIMMFRAKHGV